MMTVAPPADQRLTAPRNGATTKSGQGHPKPKGKRSTVPARRTPPFCHVCQGSGRVTPLRGGPTIYCYCTTGRKLLDDTIAKKAGR